MKHTRTGDSQEDSFDFRMVRYEFIHSIKDEFFDRLVDIVNPRMGDVVLDAGCGYGAVTREILKRHTKKKLKITLADSNHHQLARAETELGEIDFVHGSRLEFRTDNLVHSQLEEGAFDTIVAKMVIHEIPKKSQQLAIANAYRLLKAGGKFVVWDLTLDFRTQNFVQDVFRMKDRLAGFNTLERNRYFLRFDELQALLSKAGFRDIQKRHNIIAPIITSNRLDQEFGGDVAKLEQWHKFIRDRAANLEPTTLKEIGYEDNGGHITFFPSKSIITALK